MNKDRNQKESLFYDNDGGKQIKDKFTITKSE
jgi:hypothetical protein